MEEKKWEKAYMYVYLGIKVMWEKEIMQFFSLPASATKLYEYNMKIEWNFLVCAVFNRNDQQYFDMHDENRNKWWENF